MQLLGNNFNIIDDGQQTLLGAHMCRHCLCFKLVFNSLKSKQKSRERLQTTRSAGKVCVYRIYCGFRRMTFTSAAAPSLPRVVWSWPQMLTHCFRRPNNNNKAYSTKCIISITTQYWFIVIFCIWFLNENRLFSHEMHPNLENIFVYSRMKNHFITESPQQVFPAIRYRH